MLTVETGAVVPGADAYVSLAEVDQYHLDRGNAAWTGTDIDREGAIRRATDYMVQTYRQRWKGVYISPLQLLDWPRGFVQRTGFDRSYSGYYPFFMVPNNIVPDLVKHACAELALKALAGPLLADESQVVEREQVGPIVVNYSKYSPQRVRYPAIDGMLSEYLLGGGGSVSTRLARA